MTTLSDICSIVPGYAFKSRDFSQSGFPVVKITDIHPPYIDTNSCSFVDTTNYEPNKLSKYLIKRGDFAVAMTGATIGKIGRVTDGYAYINQRVAKFEIADSVTKQFVYHLLCTQSFADHISSNIDSQSAQPNISASSIGRFHFTLPSYDTQCHIVDTVC